MIQAWRSVLWRTISAMAQVCVTVLVGRLVGVESLARYGVVVAWIGLVATFTDGGLSVLVLNRPVVGAWFSSNAGAVGREVWNRRWYFFTGTSVAVFICWSVGGVAIGLIGGLLTLALVAQQGGRAVLLATGEQDSDSRISAAESAMSLLLAGLVAALLKDRALPYVLLGQGLSWLLWAWMRYRRFSHSVADEAPLARPTDLDRRLSTIQLNLGILVLLRGDVALMGVIGIPPSVLAQYQVISRVYYFLPLPFEVFAGRLIGRARSVGFTAEALLGSEWRVLAASAVTLSLLLFPISYTLLRATQVGVPSGSLLWLALGGAFVLRLLAYPITTVLGLVTAIQRRVALTWTASAIDLITVGISSALGASIVGAAGGIAMAEATLVFGVLLLIGMRRSMLSAGASAIAAGTAVCFMASAVARV